MNNKIDRKKVIFNKAALLFKKKGYTASSMRDIAFEVGIEPSSLYSHIKSKGDILERICFDCSDLFTNGLTVIIENETSVIDQLKAIISLHFDIAMENTASVTVFNNEWRHLDSEQLILFRKARKDYQNNVRRILLKGMENNIVHQMDVTIMLKTFLSSLQWIHLSSNKKDLLTSKNQIIDYILSTLLKRN